MSNGEKMLRLAGILAVVGAVLCAVSDELLRGMPASSLGWAVFFALATAMMWNVTDG